jgi:hypothetical protein
MFLRRYTGYVEQFDTLIGELTVQEMVGAHNQLPGSMVLLEALQPKQTSDKSKLAHYTMSCADHVHSRDEATHAGASLTKAGCSGERLR